MNGYFGNLFSTPSMGSWNNQLQYMTWLGDQVKYMDWFQVKNFFTQLWMDY